MQFSVDELFIKRTFDLAIKGKGKVSPNPLVGCIIVKDGKVIGEGYHEYYGGHHAEVNAINSVADKELLKGADLYVNLEPCAHFGKTPPCADLIIQYPFKRVIICNIDPFSLVAGKGAERIKSHGIEVVHSVLANEGLELNKRFFSFVEKKRPYVIFKWAETQDGFIARKDYTSKWISGNQSRQLVHKWRSEEDAIIVGTRTALVDNPQLNVRDWEGRNPIRIVIDRELKLSNDSKLFDHSQKTLCYNLHKSEVLPNLEYIRLSEDKDVLPEIMDDLYNRKVQSIIVEGGSRLFDLFIQKNIWDEARIFQGNIKFGEGIDAPILNGKLVDAQMIGEDRLFTYIPQ